MKNIIRVFSWGLASVFLSLILAEGVWALPLVCGEGYEPVVKCHGYERVQRRVSHRTHPSVRPKVWAMVCHKPDKEPKKYEFSTDRSKQPNFRLLYEAQNTEHNWTHTLEGGDHVYYIRSEGAYCRSGRVIQEVYSSYATDEVLYSEGGSSSFTGSLYWQSNINRSLEGIGYNGIFTAGKTGEKDTKSY